MPTEKTNTPNAAPSGSPARQPAKQAAGPVRSPKTPADIPGLGPIRVRALHKAGLGSLKALRAARLEDLLAVPGLSEIKARHILDYLARFPAAPGKAGKAKKMGHTADTSLAEAVEAARQAAGQIEHAHPNRLRPRLMSALAAFMALAATLPTADTGLSHKTQERALRRLRRITLELSQAAGQPDLGRKAQAELAESLVKACRKLSELGAP
ncbi:MAG TPA: helix-hairpin-helix domain-containing protein [Chthonomonadaceae bacterium]|nr:helix-hairpin-helix domain-containing protein [Chthonomonadaceae bacterium]